MSPRQKLLLITLASAVALWQGGPWIIGAVFGPVAALRAEIAEIQERVDNKADQALAIARAKKKLQECRARSLPPDPGKSKRPDAVQAQRQYTEWLTELAHAVGFEEISVTPKGRSTSRNGVYVEVSVQIDGFGRLSQLYELLDRFYRTDLQQRIGRLHVISEDVLGDPPVRFSLDAHGLTLTDAPVRRTLFPRTTLAGDLDPSARQLTTASSAEFPKKPPFRVRIAQELLDVTDQQDAVWHVERGRERTVPVGHPANSSVVLVPINPHVAELTPEAFRDLVRANPFVKPTPPVPYDMTFGPFPPAIAVRGKTLKLSLEAKGYDPSRGEPKYQLADDPLPQLTLDPQTGALTWRPGDQLPAGDYSLTVVARHPSAPDGALSQKLEITLVEPNSPPTLAPVARQTVYRGRPWRLTLSAVDSDQPPQTLSFKLAAGGPAGCRIDASTGELSWTPPDDHALGPVSLTVTVTDSGTPPQSANVTVTAEVMEDAARYTELIGIVSVDEQREAWFLNKSLNRKSIVKIGEELRAADVALQIVDIAAEHVIVRFGEAEQRLKLGDNLRRLTPGPPAKTSTEEPPADATLPDAGTPPTDDAPAARETSVP